MSTNYREIGIIGLSFKYDGTSGDIRGSPTLTLINKLTENIIKNRLSNCRYVIEDPFAVWYESADNENGDRIF